MIKNFRTYNLAIEFYRACREVAVPRFVEDQLERASSSIVLNLAEGYGRRSEKDRARFYQIAYGSLKECQAILELEEDERSTAYKKADILGAHLYKLIKAVRS